MYTHLSPDTCRFNKTTFGYVPSSVDLCMTCKKYGSCKSSGKCQCFICRITFRENSLQELKIFKIVALTLHFKIFNKIIISNHFSVNYNQFRDIQKNSTKIAQHNLTYKKIIDDVNTYYQKYLLLKLIHLCQDDVINYVQSIMYLVHQ